MKSTEERSRPREEDAALLIERAALLARPPVVDKVESVLDVVVVQVGSESIGLPSESVWGMFDDVRLTQVPGAPRWMAGLAQVRGELISVAHLSHWLGSSRSMESGVVAVLSDARGLLGMLVDAVLGFRDIQSEELSQELSAKATRPDGPFAAVTKDLVTIVDVRRLFSDPQLIVDNKGTVEV